MTQALLAYAEPIQSGKLSHHVIQKTRVLNRASKPIRDRALSHIGKLAENSFFKKIPEFEFSAPAQTTRLIRPSLIAWTWAFTGFAGGFDGLSNKDQDLMESVLLDHAKDPSVNKIFEDDNPYESALLTFFSCEMLGNTKSRDLDRWLDKRCKDGVNSIVRRQINGNGPGAGAWGYPLSPGIGDSTLTGLSLLALYSASTAQVPVDKVIINKATAFVIKMIGTDEIYYRSYSEDRVPGRLGTVANSLIVLLRNNQSAEELSGLNLNLFFRQFANWAKMNDQQIQKRFTVHGFESNDGVNAAYAYSFLMTSFALYQLMHNHSLQERNLITLEMIDGAFDFMNSNLSRFQDLQKRLSETQNTPSSTDLLCLLFFTIGYETFYGYLPGLQQ